MSFKVIGQDAIISRVSMEKEGDSRMQRPWREEGSSGPGVLNVDGAAG